MNDCYLLKLAIFKQSGRELSFNRNSMHYKIAIPLIISCLFASVKTYAAINPVALTCEYL